MKTIEICRFCLENDGNLEDIFYDSSNDYSNKIFSVTNTEALLGDGYPSVACFNCLRLLEISWKFRLQAKNSFEFLKKYYQTTLLPNSAVVQHQHASDDGVSTLGPVQHDQYCENRKHDGTTVQNEIIHIEPIQKTEGCNSEFAVMTINKCEDDLIEELESADLEIDDEQYEYDEKTIDYDSSDTNLNLRVDQKDIHSSVEELIDEVPADENVNYILDVPEQAYISEQHEETTDEIDEVSTSNVNIYQLSGYTEIVQGEQNDAAEEISMDESEEPVKSSNESMCSDFSKATTNRYRCEDCNRTFSQKGNLYTHRLSHSGVRGHLCDVCLKTFKYASHLKNHQYTHSEERRFACNICNAKFHKHSYLKTHKRQHTGERPYNCECGKSFNNLSNYKSHYMIHTGEKKYACSICSKRFTQSSAMSRHEKTCLNKTKDIFEAC